jgi:hypothetical protein
MMYGIVTISKLNRFDKVIGKDDKLVQKGLNQIIDNILRLNSEVDHIEWYDKNSLSAKLSAAFNIIVK